MDTLEIARKLKQGGFNNMLAVEIDYLHGDYGEGEDRAVASSIRELKQVVRKIEG